MMQFIHNTSFLFRWNTATTPLCNDVVSVTPLSGTLAPGASAMVEVALKPFSYPAIFDLDVICEVTGTSRYTNLLVSLCLVLADSGNMILESDPS